MSAGGIYLEDSLRGDITLYIYIYFFVCNYEKWTRLDNADIRGKEIPGDTISSLTESFCIGPLGQILLRLKGGHSKHDITALHQTAEDILQSEFSFLEVSEAMIQEDPPLRVRSYSSN